MDKFDQPKAETDAAVGAESTPRRVGRYEILQKVGSGGMGIVYKARQLDLDRIVALKELHSVYASDPEFVQRFVRESRLAGSQNHPSIVTVHDYVEEHGTCYIAMEYMSRGSLRSWVGRLSLAQLAGVLEGLLAGLAAVEPSGIVHRDLKPENVMVSDDGRVKIADFGIAKATRDQGIGSFMTATGATVGTPAYMAPEQAVSREVSPRTDLYAVGIMTYEQLVGQVPFSDRGTPVEIMLRHLNDPVPAVLENRPEVDRSLSEWVERLLVKEPAERTPSATQAWEELEEIVLELLGPRWRREARLPELGSSPGDATPLTPAPFDSHRAKAPNGLPNLSPLASAGRQPSAEPEVESGFLSYGRAPTGAASPQLASSKRHSGDESVATDRKSPDRRLEAAPTPTPPLVSPNRTRRPNARRVSAVALLAVSAAAAGFVLAPAGASVKTANAKTGSAISSKASTQEPSRAYAAALSRAIAELNGLRSGAGARLARARTPHAQAAAAVELARAHAQAAMAVRNAAPGLSERTANTDIATALSRVAAGYSAMASAASREDIRGFDRGRAAVSSAGASLTAAFARLQKLGYRVGT